MHIIYICCFQLRQLSQEEPRSPITPPPNYASALVILAQSEESLPSKQRSQSNLVRRSVSMDQIENSVSDSPRGDEPQNKRKYSKTRNIFRFSRQFSKNSGNNSARASESPKTPRTPPPYPQSPCIIPQSPPPPLTPLPFSSLQCGTHEHGTDIEIVT